MAPVVVPGLEGRGDGPPARGRRGGAVARRPGKGSMRARTCSSVGTVRGALEATRLSVFVKSWLEPRQKAQAPARTCPARRHQKWYFRLSVMPATPMLRMVTSLPNVAHWAGRGLRPLDPRTELRRRFAGFRPARRCGRRRIACRQDHERRAIPGVRQRTVSRKAGSLDYRNRRAGEPLRCRGAPTRRLARRGTRAPSRPASGPPGIAGEHVRQQAGRGSRGDADREREREPGRGG